jgi:lipid-A-disaccharide synthase
MTEGDKPLRLMLVAGEPSGDVLGAQLMASLKALQPHGVAFSGVGGPLMQEQGLRSNFSIADTSVMGLKEVVPRIPLILRRVEETADFAIETQPDLVILIDSPDFTHRIARRLKRLAPSLPIVKYVAPQVWASRPWRAKKLAEFVDYLLALLPFEPAFFERYGLKTYFVGHPVIERIPEPVPDENAKFRARHNIPETAPLLVLLPGSRFNEIRFLLPVFAETVRRLKEEIPALRVVIPTLEHVQDKVEKGAEELGLQAFILEGERAKFAAFRAATAALAASGTVSTELALAGTPMVVGYRVGWLTALISRPFLRAKYITLINLIQDEEVIPEFLQELCTSDALIAALRPLLTSQAARERQTSRTAAALQKLGIGDESPSRRAARAVLEIAGEALKAQGLKSPAPATAATD